MTSKLLSSTSIPDLSPIPELADLAEHSARYKFTARTKDEALAWQSGCRAALAEAVGFLDSPTVDAKPEVVEEVDRGDFIRRKVLIHTAPHVRMIVHLLSPKLSASTSPLPVAIAYAGHGYGVKDIVGLWEDGQEREIPDGYHDDFAVRLCRRGFLVAAPEIVCFGERQADYSYLVDQGAPSTCHHAATYAFMLGKSMIGARVRDGMRLIDYLATLPEADIRRIGVMGISGGGMLTFFHTALDERIKACVVSGYFSSFKDSILAMFHCPCNFVPGLLNIGEMKDIVGLIMPRPMLVEAGTKDTIFPIEAVRASVARTKEICAVLGGDPAKDMELDEFEGRHRISGRRAYDFLWERLA